MDIIIRDNVEYILYDYKTEDELEKIVFDNYKHVFGDDAILLPKQKIKTRSGIGTIPDGYLLLVKEKKWFIIEVELDSHPLHEHIVAQISKFSTAIKNTISRDELKKAFYEEIIGDPWKNNIFKDDGIAEIHKYISDIMENTPEIVIFIDKKGIDLDDVCKGLPFDTRIVTFKTYCIEGTVKRIYQIDGLLKMSVRKDEATSRIINQDLKIEIFAIYKEKLYKAIYYSHCNIIYSGMKYKSPSAACSVITKLNCNGWKFWNFKDEKGLDHSLDELRKKGGARYSRPFRAKIA